MHIRRTGAALAAASLFAVLLSCGTDEQEAAKFERADHDTFVRDMSEMTSFTLDNGIAVYIQEERTADQVAVEVLYRAGFLDEPRGKPQLSHVAEHLAINCATANYPAGTAVEAINKVSGRINAEAVSDFSHIDYVVPGAHLETVFVIEAERLTSLRCDAATRKREIDKVIKEIDGVVTNPKGSLAKYGLMALNQTLYHGENFVPIRGGAERITNQEVEAFVRANYRPDDAVLVIIGNIKTADAEALVRKHFAGIPRQPDPRAQNAPVKGDRAATWDIDGRAFYLVAPGPYDSFRHRLILTMFGSYLHQIFMTTQEVYSPCRSVYASNQVYRVADIPFFVFAEPAQGRTIDEIRPVFEHYVEAAATSLDDGRVELIKSGMTAFVTATGLKKDEPDYPLAHHQVIGQEALNVGMKHMLREGLSQEEFVAEVESITPDEFRAVVRKYVAPDRLQEITFTPRR